MIPDFTRGVQAMKPGEIGPLVRTEHGYHIVRRSTYDEVRDQFDAQYKGMLRQKAQFAYVEQLMTAKKVEVKPNAPKLLKEVAADLDAHKANRSALATFTNGTLTAGDAAQIFNGMPAQQREQMRQQIAQFPDSILDQVVKSMVVNELMVQQADSAGIKVDSLELNNIRNAFKGVVRNVWAGLRISPESLADSAKTPAEKERLAAARIDAYMGRLLSGQGENYVDVPAPVAEALREKYDGSVKAAGLTRALELAQKARAASDSSTAGAQPKSAVPMPDTGRGGGAPKR
jgi:hypothetical protein